MASLVCAIALTASLAVAPPASSAAGAAPPASWVPVLPQVSPAGRGNGSIAFDAAINKMVLFAATESSCGCSPETWTYDGNTWTRQLPRHSPPPRSGGAMAYDPALGKILLFGGFGERTGTPYADTWTYNGHTWTRQSPAMSPPTLFGASMAFDPAINKMVLFGGEEPFSVLSAETWTYDGVTWTQESPATSPSPRNNAAMAFDPGSHDVVLFGGAKHSVASCVPLEFGDTWTYDGTTWHRQTPAMSPSPREDMVMADDPAAGGVVLFGGVVTVYASRQCGQQFERFNDTWTYRRGTWSRLASSASPAPRYAASMDYDPQTRQLLVFGGATEVDQPQPETWAYQAVGSGYRLVASDGDVFAFGAPYRGSAANLQLSRPIVGIAADPGTGGYWCVASDGGVVAFDAPLFGSDRPLDRPIVGIAAAPDGRGYWLAASDGEVFDFGPGALPPNGAPNGPLHLNQPIVGIAADPTAGGYRLVASDGVVFAFGAPSHGGAGHLRLNQPIVGMASDPATGGYWLVAKDGGVFSFDAPFYGSTGNRRLNQPIVGITAAPDGQGYRLVAKDGGVFSFGPGAIFHGSTGNRRLRQPIVGMTGS